MRDDLKPCPFCGSRETSTSYATNTEGVVSSRFVECEDCAAMGPAVDVDALAIAAWNRRAALQQGRRRTRATRTWAGSSDAPERTASTRRRIGSLNMSDEPPNQPSRGRSKG